MIGKIFETVMMMIQSYHRGKKFVGERDAVYEASLMIKPKTIYRNVFIGETTATITTWIASPS